MNTIVLPAPGAQAAAAALATGLGAELGTVESRRFPDGEIYLRLRDSVEGKEAVVVATLREPDPLALALWYLAATARELGALRVSLVVPYLPYMRQDTRFQPGEAVTSGLFARFLSEQFDWLVTVDPHLHRHASLSEIYTIPADVVASAPAVARWVQSEVRDPVLVGPDSESEQWVADVARRVGCPVIILDKTRHGDREVEITGPDARAHAGRTPVLVDDIISSARTMAKAADRVRQAFGVAPVCIGVHAVFTPDAMSALHAAGVQRVATCNTLPHPTNAIDVMPDIVQAVQRRLRPRSSTG